MVGMGKEDGVPQAVAPVPSLSDLFGKATRGSAPSSNEGKDGGEAHAVAPVPSLSDLLGKATQVPPSPTNVGVASSAGRDPVAPAHSIQDHLATAARPASDGRPDATKRTYNDLGSDVEVQHGEAAMDTHDISAEAWASSFKGTSKPALSLSALKAAANLPLDVQQPKNTAIQHMQRTYHGLDALAEPLGAEALALLSAQDVEQRRTLYRHLKGMKVERSGSKDSIRRRFDRERNARLQAENLIEQASRDLYLAKEATQKALAAEQRAKDKVEEALLNLNAAVKAADNAEQRRRAVVITGSIGILLYLVSEFVIDATIESHLQGPGVVLAKLSILVVLLPLQMIIERLSVKSTGAEGSSVREHLFSDLLRVLLEDEHLTEKELRTIETFRVHHGLSHVEATEILHNVMDDLGLERTALRL
jgi:hypothetical protein